MLITGSNALVPRQPSRSASTDLYALASDLESGHLPSSSAVALIPTHAHPRATEQTTRAHSGTIQCTGDMLKDRADRVHEDGPTHASDVPAAPVDTILPDRTGSQTEVADDRVAPTGGNPGVDTRGSGDSTLSAESLVTTAAGLSMSRCTLSATLAMSNLKSTLQKADTFVSQYPATLQHLDNRLMHLRQSRDEHKGFLAQAIAGQAEISILAQVQPLAWFEEQVEQVVRKQQAELESVSQEISRVEDVKRRREKILNDLEQLEKSTKTLFENILALDGNISVAEYDI